MLRDAAGLPRGGETFHKHEIIKIARKLSIPVGRNTAKNKLIFRIVQEHVWNDERSWDEAKRGARDYQYLTSREARKLAKVIDARD